eukprot:TRINITY_DN171_c1_g2_i2.p4 TRINITY_DN171_c1_g2~~TRINITY_DN171_c1_g2_i2.p4  ORF type:complete len:127 (+),score=0.41 TRINITY_DN171_c1_g2_i2:1377-1757(+)
MYDGIGLALKIWLNTVQHHWLEEGIPPTPKNPIGGGAGRGMCAFCKPPPPPAAVCSITVLALPPQPHSFVSFTMLRRVGCGWWWWWLQFWYLSDILPRRPRLSVGGPPPGEGAPPGDRAEGCVGWG